MRSPASYDRRGIAAAALGVCSIFGAGGPLFPERQVLSTTEALDFTFPLESHRRIGHSRRSCFFVSRSFPRTLILLFSSWRLKIEGASSVFGGPCPRFDSP